MYNSSHQSSHARTLPLPPPSRNRARPNIPPLMRSQQWSYSGGLAAHAYPSPPMTTSPNSPKRQQFLDERQHPPAPPQQPQHLQYSHSHSREHFPSATSAPNSGPSRTTYMGSQILPAPAGPPHYAYGPHYQPVGYPDQHEHLQPRQRAQSIPPYQQSYPATAYAQNSMVGMQAMHPHHGHVFQGPLTVSPVVGRIPRAGSRRAKAHVARACQNCKKAHLSCDEQRPCSRCVSTRREATCIDVEHKKRGRPRIQPERGPIGAHRGPPAITPPSAHLPTASDSSYRSLRSHEYSESERRGSLPVTSSHPHSHPPPHYYQHHQSQSHSHHVHGDPRLPQPPHSASADITSFRQAASFESRRWRDEPMPLVLLVNLNFTIIRAMEPLRALIGDRGELRGAPLQDLLDPRHHDVMRRMQTDFRNERNLREPNQLPSIFSAAQEHEAVQHITEDDIPRLTQGSSVDCSDTWTLTLSHGRTETFTCRLRLAKVETFFVVVELQRAVPQQQQPTRYLAGPPADLFARRSPVKTLPQPSRDIHPSRTAPTSPLALSEPHQPFPSQTGQLMTSLGHGPTKSPLPSPYSVISPSREPTYDSSGYFPRQPEITSPGTSNYTQIAAASMQPPPQPSSSSLPPLQRTISTREVHRPETLSNIQLPPIVSTSAPTTPLGSTLSDSQPGTVHRQSQQTPATTSTQEQQGSAGARRSSSDQDTDEESSRKRRRLNIGEIIEK